MSWKKTIWFRLTIGFIAILLLTNVVLSLFGVFGFSKIVIGEVQTRVRMDLNSARKVFEEHVDDICLLLRGSSARRSVPFPLGDWDKDDLHKLLQNIRQVGKLDVLSLLDEDGRIIYRENNPERRGDNVSHNSIIARAMKEKTCFRGTVIVAREDLKKEGADLMRKASIDSEPTHETSLKQKIKHGGGMFIGAAVPLVDLQKEGKIVGYFYGANLLNRSHGIVDEIMDDLYQNERYKGKDIGAATIFLENYRISTTLKRKDGSRAIGTLLSKAVHDKVLVDKKIWASRALVVGDWYITAYEPIRNPAGMVIGSIGVGMLETPFQQTRKLAVWIFLGVVAFTTVASLILLALVTKTVLRPIERIIKMSNKVVAGDLSARVDMQPPGEMGLLCRAINQMAEAVSQREEALAQTTRRQIGQSEKMAAIGRMAAGIAHEINNPLTGVLTLEHLLKSEEGLSKEGRGYLDIMYSETSRMREIVMGLLNFARESSSKMKPLDINEVIRQTLKLLRNQKEFNSIAIEENLAAGLPQVHGDANLLQQVLVNLYLNSCEAMPQGGRLSISTLEKHEKVLVSIEDTGCGIEKEHLEMIFDPFFTTKPVGKGTGLGLSVSYGIIRQHGGTMEVQSKEGQGTIFTIALPVASG